MSRVVVESRLSHRFIGQLNSGDDLLQGILAVCRHLDLRCATVQAAGVLQEVSLINYDAGARAMGTPRTFRTPVTLLSCHGILAERRGRRDLSLTVVVSRQRDNGMELLGGQCSGGRVMSCEFVLDPYHDLVLRRGLDRNLGLNVITEAISANDAATTAQVQDELTREPRSIPVEVKPPGTQRGWELPPAPMEETAPAPPPELAMEPAAEEEDEPYRSVSTGDILEHQQFGRCEVQRISSDDEFVTVRLRNNRTVRLSLDVLDLHFQGEEEGHQVFTASPARR